VLELDGRPALDAYLDRLVLPLGDEPSAEEVVALGRLQPLGLMRRTGEELVRTICDVDVSQRSLTFLAEIPQGGLLWTMAGSRESVLAATDEACADAVSGLLGSAPRGVLVFGAAGRVALLGEDGTREAIGRMHHHAGGAPLAGCASAGQLARIRGLAGLHEQALVAVAVA
jgi:hypothetical protein